MAKTSTFRFRFPKNADEIARVREVASILAHHARSGPICAVTGYPLHNPMLCEHRFRDNPDYHTGESSNPTVSVNRWELVGDALTHSYTLRISDNGDVQVRSADAQALAVVPASAKPDGYLAQCEVLACLEGLPIGRN
jgi:hypothetical protein